MRCTIPCGARPEPHDSATRRAVHAQVVADPAHDDRPRVEPDAHLEREPALRLELPAVLADRALDPERGLDGASRAVLVGDGRAGGRRQSHGGQPTGSRPYT